jgi:hypothetical protein
MNKLTLDLDSLTVTTFETPVDEGKTSPNAATLQIGCQGCNGTRLTCSTALC